MTLCKDHDASFFDGEDPTTPRRQEINDTDSTVGASTKDDNSDNETPTVQDPNHNHLPDPIPTPHNAEKKSRCIELYKAALKGDWKTAKSIFDIDPSAVTMKINDQEETALHIAANAKHVSFVVNLVQLTSSSDLAAKCRKGSTALIFAAMSGVIRIAKVMIDKNPNLPNVLCHHKIIPLETAIMYRHKNMASFLFSKTNFEALDTSKQISLLAQSILSDYYDIALEILEKKPKLATERLETGYTALHMLATKSSAIGSSSELSFWKRYINSRFKGIYNKALMQTLAHQVVEHLWNVVVQNIKEGELLEFIETPSRLLDIAASVGNVEFLIILIRSYPDLLWKFGDDRKSMFHIAVENRQERVFSLIYEIGGLKDFLANCFDEKKGFNLLHLAGTLAAPYHLSRVSGAALQMQRELLWFKEVEKLLLPLHRRMRCSISELSQIDVIRDPIDRLTPRELFTKEHKQLLKDGEEWMKNTANSCMLVATLIATVVFAAAFTVPGGNDEKNGIPVFRQKQAFTVFVISDVVALVSSTTSILTFLSILTSRFAEDDFLVLLPTKLLVGLVMLFVSIACMVVAFSATFFIAYDQTKAKIPLAIAATAIVPVGCFCVFYSKLVVDILHSAYWSTFSLKRRKRRLF